MGTLLSLHMTLFPSHVMNEPTCEKKSAFACSSRINTSRMRMYQYSSSFRKSIVQSSFRDGDATEEAHGAAVASRFIGFGKAHFVHRCHHHHHRTERRQRRSESKKRRTERLNPLSSYSWSRARLVNSSSSSCWCCLFPRPPFLFVCVFVCFLWLESDVIFIARENGRHDCKERGQPRI